MWNTNRARLNGQLRTLGHRHTDTAHALPAARRERRLRGALSRWGAQAPSRAMPVQQSAFVVRSTSLVTSGVGINTETTQKDMSTRVRPDPDALPYDKAVDSRRFVDNVTPRSARPRSRARERRVRSAELFRAVVCVHRADICPRTEWAAPTWRATEPFLASPPMDLVGEILTLR